VAVRVGLAEIGRPNYIAPFTYTTHDLSTFSSPPQGNPTAWWTDQPSFYDAAGHVISTGGGPVPSGAAYAIQHYQPGDRFWAFQSIESGILTLLAAILIGFALYWVTRRVS
jgi:hypothetical protein